jgi:hypothetical protein
VFLLYGFSIAFACLDALQDPAAAAMVALGVHKVEVNTRRVFTLQLQYFFYTSGLHCMVWYRTVESSPSRWPDCQSFIRENRGSKHKQDGLIAKVSFVKTEEASIKSKLKIFGCVAY